MRGQPFFAANNAQIFIAGQQVGYMQAIRIEETFNSYRLKTLWNRQNIAFIPGTEDISFSASKAFVDYQSLLANASFLSGLVSQLLTKGGSTIGTLSALPVTIGNSLTSALGTAVANSNSTQINASLGISPGSPLSFDSVEQYQILANQNSSVTQLLITAFQGLLNGQFSLGTIFAIADFTINMRGPATPTMAPVTYSAGQLAPGTTIPPAGITEGVTTEGATASILPTETSGLIANSQNATNIIDVFTLFGCRLTARTVTATTGNIIVMEEVQGMARRWQETYEQDVAAVSTAGALLGAIPTSS